MAIAVECHQQHETLNATLWALTLIITWCLSISNVQCRSKQNKRLTSGSDPSAGARRIRKKTKKKHRRRTQSPKRKSKKSKKFRSSKQKRGAGRSRKRRARKRPVDNVNAIFDSRTHSTPRGTPKQRTNMGIKRNTSKMKTKTEAPGTTDEAPGYDVVGPSKENAQTPVTTARLKSGLRSSQSHSKTSENQSLVMKAAVSEESSIKFRPKIFLKTSKEKLIAAGAKKSAEGYPTIDDIPSNWTEKEKGKSGKVANQEEEEERKQEGQQIAGAAKSPSEQEGPPKQEPKDNLDEALDREPEDPIFVPTTH